MTGARKVSNQPLHYIDTGTGSKSLVLVHGFTCDHTDWQAQIDTLRTRFRIVAVDLNGHGRTPPGEPDPATMGCELATLIDHLKLENPVLAGHSMGTRVIAQAATQRPTAGLIMVDGSRGASTPEQLERVLAIRDTQDYQSYAKNLFGQMFTENIDPDIRQRIIQRAIEMDPHWAMALHANVASFDLHQLPQTLAAITAPMLAIQCTTRGEDGGRQSLSPGASGTAYTDFLASYFKHSQSAISILPDTSHFPQFEATDALSEMMADFCEKLFKTK